MSATADHQPESCLQKMTIRYPDILTQIETIDPVAYAKTRNFTDGAVTRLSPYISRGVISGKQILLSLQNRGFRPEEMMTLLRELSWREYNQRVWQARGADIDFDLKSEQEGVCEYGLPVAVLQHQTGIQALDSAIKELYATGYMHNHVRMYVASVVCNIARCYSKIPAQWKLTGAKTIFYYKEHSSNVHYQGTEVPRDWLFLQVTGYFSSFSKYWKQCLKHLT